MFFSLQNLSSQVAAQVPEPWTIKSAAPYDLPKDSGWREWVFNPATQHHFISAYEGVSPNVRVSDTNDNPVFKVHGIIADYDGAFDRAVLPKLRSKPPSLHRPTHAVISKSNQVHFVWQFERPLMVATPAEMKAFLKIVMKELALPKWAAGFDTKAYSQTHQYFELGREWVEFCEDYRIPASVGELWMMKAEDGIRLVESEGLKYTIPIEALAEAVATQYPGKWVGDFAIGSRGVRFWDPSADNITAAVVTADGMRCFTGPKPFVSWKEIFGKAFVEKYEADYVERATKDIYHDGAKFLVPANDGKGTYVPLDVGHFEIRMRINGYSDTKAKGERASEVEYIRNHIVVNNHVDTVVPVLYAPQGRVWVGDKLVLNTCRVAPHPPALPPADVDTTDFDAYGQAYFPDYHKLATSLFGPFKGESRACRTYLASLRYWYASSLEGQPTSGHAIILAGAPNSGKTLWGRRFVGALMCGNVYDGFADAAGWLVGGGRFNTALSGKPVWAVDDATHSADVRDASRFTQRLKALVANAFYRHEAKFKNEVEIPFHGRVIYTCNRDTDSRYGMPDFDSATKDKIMLFSCGSYPGVFPAEKEIYARIADQVAHFARFLLDWTPPSDCVQFGVTRFGGINPYQDTEILEETYSTGVEGLLRELLSGFFKTYSEGHPGAAEWSGTAVELVQDLAACYPDAVRELKASKVGTILGHMKNHGYPVEYKHKKTGNVWTFKFTEEEVIAGIKASSQRTKVEGK